MQLEETKKFIVTISSKEKESTKFKELTNMANATAYDMWLHFEIPSRTYRRWLSGERDIPEYIAKPLEKLILLEQSMTGDDYDSYYKDGNLENYFGISFLLNSQSEILQKLMLYTDSNKLQFADSYEIRRRTIARWLQNETSVNTWVLKLLARIIFLENKVENEKHHCRIA